MTNSKKIKAYLDAGHKVKLERKSYTGFTEVHILFGICEDPDDGELAYLSKEEQDGVGGFIYCDWEKLDECDISIRQEPLRYPKVGDKVVILESARSQGFSKHVGEVCIVAENNHYGCLIFIENVNNKHLIDYRHLSPYIED